MSNRKLIRTLALVLFSTTGAIVACSHGAHQHVAQPAPEPVARAPMDPYAGDERVAQISGDAGVPIGGSDGGLASPGMGSGSSEAPTGTGAGSGSSQYPGTSPTPPTPTQPNPEPPTSNPSPAPAPTPAPAPGR
jgi:hypothetical protein